MTFFSFFQNIPEFTSRRKPQTKQKNKTANKKKEERKKERKKLKYIINTYIHFW